MSDSDYTFGLSHEVGAMLHCCEQAMQQKKHIYRESRRDKEFPFQNWFKARLEERKVAFDESGRNTYPDFCLTSLLLGYELKGLGYPGRMNDYDCNSQIPQGQHQGREIIYVFGRYPAHPDANHYPLIDLVLCHGSFLNADHQYVHRNKSIRGMGSYGDVLLRDRKMYVAPTPFGILAGLENATSLILPQSWPAPTGLTVVGNITRQETSTTMTGYHFDLTTNQLHATYTKNPAASQLHHFVVYAVNTSEPRSPVYLHHRGQV
jgi:hypothetical protein